MAWQVINGWKQTGDQKVSSLSLCSQRHWVAKNFTHETFLKAGWARLFLFQFACNCWWFVKTVTNVFLTVVRIEIQIASSVLVASPVHVVAVCKILRKHTSVTLHVSSWRSDCLIVNWVDWWIFQLSEATSGQGAGKKTRLFFYSIHTIT